MQVRNEAATKHGCGLEPLARISLGTGAGPDRISKSATGPGTPNTLGPRPALDLVSPDRTLGPGPAPGRNTRIVLLPGFLRKQSEIRSATVRRSMYMLGQGLCLARAGGGGERGVEWVVSQSKADQDTFFHGSKRVPGNAYAHLNNHYYATIRTSATLDDTCAGTYHESFEQSPLESYLDRS